MDQRRDRRVKSRDDATHPTTLRPATVSQGSSGSIRQPFLDNFKALSKSVGFSSRRLNLFLVKYNLTLFHGRRSIDDEVRRTPGVK